MQSCAYSAMDTNNKGNIGLATFVTLPNGSEDTEGNGKEQRHYENIDVYSNLPYRDHITRPQKPGSMLDRLASVQSSKDQETSVEMMNRKKAFLTSIRRRDLNAVTRDLQEEPELSAFWDMNGVCSLSAAVAEGPTIMEKFIAGIKEDTKQAIWIEHALLYAIHADKEESVKFLLDKRQDIITKFRGKEDHSSSRTHSEAPTIKWKFRQKSRHLLLDFEDAKFPVYVTPVTLAAKLNRVEILKLLLERDASEIHPLTNHCPFGGYESRMKGYQCEICRERKVFKTKREVEDSKRMLEIYTALSSPTYLFTEVEDPILEVFYISREMKNLSREDMPFKDEYEEICKRCQQFSCDVLDLCQSTDEIETLLNRGGGIDDVKSCPDNVEYQRLLLAVSYQQTRFLTHPSCQQVLQRKWYEGLPDWVCETEHRNFLYVIYLLLWLLLWPFACLLFMGKCWPWVQTFMKHPVNKFISDTISFVFFLVLLSYECNNNDENETLPKSWFTPIEFVIIAWVIGMFARQIKLVHRHHRSCRLDVTIDSPGQGFWRRFDLIQIIFFFIWMILHTIGCAVMMSKEEFDTPRQQWKSGNLILISEGFFSLGTLLSFFKLVGLFKASSSLGPLQISLSLMLEDIIRFLIIFFITMTGFVMAITNLYSHYKTHERYEELTGREAIEAESEYVIRKQADDLTKLRFTYKTLFWALFGYGETSVADIVVNNVRTVNNGTSDLSEDTYDPIVKHKVTEGFGYFFYGAYHIVAVIVLINMLIAMMARSYERIESNSDIEWKYARTRLRMMYFSEVGSLPPPFNIMLIGSIMKCILKRSPKCCVLCCRQVIPKRESENDKYKILIGKIGKRYMNKLMQEKQMENGSVLSDDDIAKITEIINKRKS